jgi:hypothetical protein
MYFEIALRLHQRIDGLPLVFQVGVRVTILQAVREDPFERRAISCFRSLQESFMSAAYGGLVSGLCYPKHREGEHRRSEQNSIHCLRSYSIPSAATIVRAAVARSSEYDPHITSHWHFESSR